MRRTRGRASRPAPNLVQLYTGFVYRGPALLAEILDIARGRRSRAGTDMNADASAIDATAAADAVHALRLQRLPPVCRGHRERRGGYQPVPARRDRNHHRARRTHRTLAGTAQSRQRHRSGAHRGLHRRGSLHRLHQVPAALPGGRHRRRAARDAHRVGRAVHRLRAVHRALPGRLHRHGPAARQSRTCARWRCRPPSTAACATKPTTSASSVARPSAPPCSPTRNAARILRAMNALDMNSAKRRAIFERFRAANPHPTTELEY